MQLLWGVSIYYTDDIATWTLCSYDPRPDVELLFVTICSTLVALSDNAQDTLRL